jgi:ATP-binding cassette subfamily B protein
VRRLSRAAQDRLADASAYAANNLGAARTMLAFGQ